MRILFASILVAVAVAANAQGQLDHFGGLAWNIHVPVSNTDYVARASTRGFQATYHVKVTDKYFAGIDFTNATFDDYQPRQTYFTENGAVTTDIFSYRYAYGLTLTGDYFFTPEKRLTPFVSLGLGANYNSYVKYYNIYENEDSSWGLLVRPEAGAMIKIGRAMPWGLVGSVRLDYSTAKSEMAGYNGIASLGFKLGVVFLSWD